MQLLLARGIYEKRQARSVEAASPPIFQSKAKHNPLRHTMLQDQFLTKLLFTTPNLSPPKKNHHDLALTATISQRANV